MPNKIRSENNPLSALIAITAVSSCLMLGAVGAYRLTVGGTPPRQEKTTENSTVSETEFESE